MFLSKLIINQLTLQLYIKINAQRVFRNRPINRSCIHNMI